MAVWQGLYDNVIGTTYALAGKPIPISRKVYREMQKRGNLSVSQNLKDNAGVVMVVPATRGQSLYSSSDLGGLRTINNVNIASALSDTNLHTIFDTKVSLNLVADKSGNGGGVF